MDRRTFEEVKAEADHAVARETADSVITYRGNGGSDDHTINLAAAYLDLAEGGAPFSPDEWDQICLCVGEWRQDMEKRLRDTTTQMTGGTHASV